MPLVTGVMSVISVAVLGGWAAARLIVAEATVAEERRWLAPLGALALGVATVSVLAATAASWLMMMHVGLRTAGLLTTMLTVALAGVAIARHAVSPFLTALAAQWRRHRGAILVVAVGSTLVLLYVALALIRFGDPSWDAWWYHIPIADSMLQADGIYHMPMIVPWVHYPAFFELQGTYLGLVVGSVIGFSLIQVGYALLFLTVAATTAAKRHGNWAGVIVVAGFLAVPSVWPQLFTAYVDVAVAALFGMACVALLAGWQSRSGWHLVPAAAVLGAIPAAKAIGIVAVVPAVVLVVVAVWLRLGLVRVTALVALLAMPVAPFLARNQVEHGNPFYPIEVVSWLHGDGFSVGEMRIEHDIGQRPPQWRDMSQVEVVALSLLVVPTLGQGGLDYDAREGGLGIVWLAVVVLGVAAATRRRDLRARHGPLLALIAMAVAAWALLPAPWWARFAVAPGIVVFFAFVLMLPTRLLRPVGVAALTVCLITVALVEAGRIAENDGAQRAVGAPFSAGYEPALTSQAQHVVVVGRYPAMPGLLWGTQPGSRTVEQAGDLEAATTADPGALLLVRPAAVTTLDPAILARYRQTSFVDPVTREPLTWLAPEES